MIERMAICQYLGCGKEFVAYHPRARFCPGCRELRDQDMKRARMERSAWQQQQEEAKKPKPPNESVRDIAAKAREAGLSYGQYVARMK